MRLRIAALFGCALLMTVGITWIFLGQRSVMDLGGRCASGGPYVVATPCPDHVPALMGLGIFLMLVGAFAGTVVAGTVGAPTLLQPMWWLLFGSLGWNFLEYGLFSGDIAWGWTLSGLLSLAMAAPALWLQRPNSWLLAYAAVGVAGAGLGWATFTAWT
ncbi:hypothetical protein [Nocardioides sp. SR21]|uniref:hypothetical protein n=1 Tax=Nocardioides sp. SR21 TaxID=2919501 RepID=UPI001FA9680C|nr:hypothetical protein [Nocardioides sp. SR21]